jgi:hypothetical protein
VSLAFFNPGRSIAARIEMIAMTTNSSIKVKHLTELRSTESCLQNFVAALL